MQWWEKQIGRVHNLVVFEAAARQLSFPQAAGELGVTQLAVSQSILHPEDALDVNLFQRRHRSLTLTAAGERLAEEVSNGFARILAAARQIGRKAHTDHVTPLVSTAFVTSWMVPRLAEFRAAHPGIDLRLESVGRDIDPASEATTLAVRPGRQGKLARLQRRPDRARAASCRGKPRLPGAPRAALRQMADHTLPVMLGQALLKASLAPVPACPTTPARRLP